MEENDGAMVRFRLVFDDRHLLDKSQRSQGLRRCWFRLKPDIKNIGELAYQIRDCFGLRHPIVLFMDDFVLPSFESTCIITDTDIIMVKRKEAKQKDISKPYDGQNLLQDSENARAHDLSFNKNHLADDKSQENSQGNGSYDKEILTSFMENSVHLDHLGDVVSTKRKRKHSKKLLDSKDQCDEINHENGFEPSNTSDLRKKKQARPPMSPHSSDGEEYVVGSVVQAGCSSFQPQEHGSQQADETQKKQARPPMSPHSSDGEEYVVGSVVQAGCSSFQPLEHGSQQADETQKPLLLDEENSIKEQDRKKENTFPQTYDNDQCFKVDGEPVSDGILPLPEAEVISSAIDIKKPCNHIIHFAILPPLRRLPVKGDILAYRYIELSSLVYPQLSSPQVGEVSSFDNKTLQILLLPVLDFVLLSEENSHGTTVQPNASRCKEDGSLEIEYLSLVDVRMVKAPGPEEEEKPCQDDRARKDKWKEALVKGRGNEPNASTAEQDNNWAQWIPSKSATAMPGGFKQSNPPFPGRGRGRAIRAPYSCMNNRIPNMNATNWNPNRNSGAWNPNRSNARFTAIDDAAALNWSYRPSGLPFP